jgi:hypothetical protein
MQYKRFVVMLDSFGHDTCGNPIAHHTVYAYRTTADSSRENPAALLYQTKKRQQVGYSDQRNEWAPSALRKANAPSGLEFKGMEGSRSEGVIRLIYDMPEQYKNQTIIKAMALAFFASAYADRAEETGNSLRGEIMDQLPETIDPAAMHAANTLYMDLERINKRPVEYLFRLLCDVCKGQGDREHTEDIFGHYAAMQAMGHGVGLDDAFGRNARQYVQVPYVEFGSHSLENDYFTQE